MSETIRDIEAVVHGHSASALSIDPEALDTSETLDAVGFDSLAMVEFVTQVEGRFDVQIDAVALSESLDPDLPVAELAEVPMMLPKWRRRFASDRSPVDSAIWGTTTTN